MKQTRPVSLALSIAASALASCSVSAPTATPADRRGIEAIDTVVVIYAENRGFDNLYGLYPGANGVPGVNPTSTPAASATASSPALQTSM